MERLTNHFSYCECAECKYYDEELAKCNKCKIFITSTGHCHDKKVWEKLRDYEDLEEKGLLLKLPCKIGSIVYVVGTKCLKGEEPIGGCGKNICDGCILNETYTVFERDADTHLMKLLLFEHNENFIFNKTVFLTREEAEKALERLESAE